MKNIIKTAAFFLGAVLFSCQTQPDVGIIDNFPPTILSTTPTGTTKVGNSFDLKVVFVDGPSSPLASATVTLADSAGKTTYYTGTKALTGTKDSVVVSGDLFKATTLPLGAYSIIIEAVDKNGNKTDKTVTFKVSQNLYPANNKEMYLAGVFDNWGAEAFTLTGPYTWTIKNQDLKGGQYKFKNTVDWTDADWGDPSCTGLMILKAGNSTCVYNGLVNITFYDNTLKYSVTPAVTFARNVTNLFFLGTINNFEGSAYNFMLTADHTWNLASVRMKGGDQFKFSVGPYGGDSFGDSGTPGVAADQAQNITLASTYADAFYAIEFNDKTLAYTLTLVGYPYPDAMFLVGDAGPGWSADGKSPIPFVKTDVGKFELYTELSGAAGTGFKYIPQNTSFDNDWGPQASDATNASGTLSECCESNASVSTTGFYRITLDFTTNTFTVTLVNFSVVGDATPGGWPSSPPAVQSDTDMTWVSGTTWAVDVTLVPGALKFRANHDWGINFGDGGSGKLVFNGSNNITSPATAAASYHVVMDLDPVNGYTYTITPN